MKVSSTWGDCPVQSPRQPHPKENAQPLQQQQEQQQKAQSTQENTTPLEDACEVSAKAKEFLRKQQEAILKQQEEDIAQQRKFFEDMLGKTDKKKEDAYAKSLREKLQCAKIAAQIRKGNFVKRQDEQFLLKKDPQLYMMSVSLRQQAEKPKKCSRISEKDDNPNSVPGLEWMQNSEDSTSSSIPATPVQPPAEEK